MKLISKYWILFSLGGIAYLLIELMWRGYSHWSMFILGGICFVAIGLLNEVLPTDFPLVWQALLGALLITTLEFIAGCILNLWLGLNVWDYSNMPLNLMGQVCLPYFILWFALCPIAILFDDWLRYRLFEEEKPTYRIW